MLFFQRAHSPFIKMNIELGKANRLKALCMKQNNTWNKQTMCQQTKTKHLQKSMAKKEKKALFKQTAFDKEANSIKYASIIYKNINIWRQSWLIN